LSNPAASTPVGAARTFLGERQMQLAVRFQVLTKDHFRRQKKTADRHHHDGPRFSFPERLVSAGGSACIYQFFDAVADSLRTCKHFSTRRHLIIGSTVEGPLVAIKKEATQFIANPRQYSIAG
jgi:hypothetical protein